MDAKSLAIGTVVGGTTVFVTGLLLFAVPPLSTSTPMRWIPAQRPACSEIRHWCGRHSLGRCHMAPS